MSRTGSLYATEQLEKQRLARHDEQPDFRSDIAASEHT